MINKKAFAPPALRAGNLENQGAAMYREYRCGHCGKLLARGSGGLLQIKCHRCKTLNSYQ